MVVEGTSVFVGQRDKKILQKSFAKIFSARLSGKKKKYYDGGIVPVLPHKSNTKGFSSDDLVAYNIVREVIGEYIVWKNLQQKKSLSLDDSYYKLSGEYVPSSRIQIGDVKFFTQPNRNIFMFVPNSKFEISAAKKVDFDVVGSIFEIVILILVYGIVLVHIL